MRSRHQDPNFGRAPDDLSDEELYESYQFAKEHGPQLRLDELQLEIAQRWEDQVERADDTDFTLDGRFTGEGFSLSVYAGENMSVEEEVWFTWDEVDDRKGDEQSDFTFNL